MEKCPWCRKSFEVDKALFCPYCGKQLSHRRQTTLTHLKDLEIATPLQRDRLKLYLFGTFISNLSDHEILQAIGQLTKARRQVIIRSYGLDGKHYRTDRQIAGEVNTDPNNASRVRRTAEQDLYKLLVP